MHLLSRCRTAAARHPLAYWSLVLALATAAVCVLRQQRADVTAARDAWGTTRSVAVARRDLAPGDPPAVRLADLPAAMVPAGAVDPATLAGRASGVVVVQHVGEGEVLTSLDLGTGPLAVLPPGWLAIAVRTDPSPPVAVGDAVQLLTADGPRAATAVVVDVDVADAFLTIGVPAADASAVAEAARLQLLTVAVSRPGSG